MVSRYETGRQWRVEKKHNLALKERVMGLLGPLLDRNKVSRDARQQLEDILIGYAGSIELGVDAVKALQEGGLLRPLGTTGILDGVGWKDIYESKIPDLPPRRYHSYEVRLPKERKAIRNSQYLANRFLTISAVPTGMVEVESSESEYDFTRWLLERSHFGKF